MEEVNSSKAFRDESAKSGKSVVFGNLSEKFFIPLKADEQMGSPRAESRALSQTSSLSISGKESVKLEDKLNYYHLVELNELFKV